MNSKTVSGDDIHASLDQYGSGIYDIFLCYIYYCIYI